MIFVGDIGVKIVLDVGTDISSATVLKIYYQKPDGTSGSWDASLESDNQSISYTTTTANDLDQAGTWELQSYVEDGGYKGRGDITRLMINATLASSIKEYTTLDDVRKYLGLATTFTTDDDFIGTLITSVSAQIESYCDRILAEHTVTEYLDGDGKSVIILSEYPINSITTIHDDVDRAYTSSTLIASTDYSYDDNGIVKLDGITTSIGINNIKIIYSAGYKVLPADLAMAVKKLVAYEYLLAKAGANSMKSENSEQLEAMKKEAYEVLDGYKKIR